MRDTLPNMRDLPAPDSTRRVDPWSWTPARARVWPSGALGDRVREMASCWCVTGARQQVAPPTHAPIQHAGSLQVEGWRVTVIARPARVRPMRTPHNIIRLVEGQIVELP